MSLGRIDSGFQIPGVGPHTEFTPVTTNSSFPGLPAVVRSGELSDDLESPTEIDLIEIGQVTENDIEVIRARVSCYQPMLMVVNTDGLSESAFQLLTRRFDEHLFFKVFLVTHNLSKRNEGQRFMSFPMLSPCHGVSSFFLPADEAKLQWEYANFFVLAKQFHNHCKKLLKIRSLTDREWQVANYIALGMPNKRIGSMISFSEKTVEKCRGEIYAKLGVNSGPEVASLITFKNFFRWPSSVKFPRIA